MTRTHNLQLFRESLMISMAIKSCRCLKCLVVLLIVSLLGSLYLLCLMNFNNRNRISRQGQFVSEIKLKRHQKNPPEQWEIKLKYMSRRTMRSVVHRVILKFFSFSICHLVLLQYADAMVDIEQLHLKIFDQHHHRQSLLKLSRTRFI